MLGRITRRHLPSPSLVVGVAALFVGLTGGALAAGIVPLARHARTADSATVAGNARHLGGKTMSEILTAAHGQQGLQGPAGPAGPEGQTGAVGPKGDTGATGATGQQGPKGDKGDKGDTGSGLKILGVVAAPSDLPSGGTNTVGDAYLVSGDLYVWDGTAWTNAGPVQGPKGDPGGAAGYAIVASSGISLNPDEFGSDTASCPAGKVAVGGGVKAANPSILFVMESYPSADGSGWNGTAADDNNAASTSFIVYAVCISS